MKHPPGPNFLWASWHSPEARAEILYSWTTLQFLSYLKLCEWVSFYGLLSDLDVKTKWATGTEPCTRRQVHNNGSACSVFSLPPSVPSCTNSLSGSLILCLPPSLHFLPTLTNSHSPQHEHAFFPLRRECRPPLWQEEGSKEWKQHCNFFPLYSQSLHTYCMYVCFVYFVCMCVVVSGWVISTRTEEGGGETSTYSSPSNARYLESQSVLTL